MTDRGRGPDRLVEAVRTLAHRRAAARRTPPAPGDLPARVAALEREVYEVRTRINALFFTVLGAVVVDLVGRAVLS